MPLPLFLGIGAAVAGTIGVGSGIHGAVKMKKANDTMKSAEWYHSKNLAKLEEQNKKTTSDMDNLGSKELEILKSFDDFSRVFEQIKSKPEFKVYQKDGVNIPKYDAEELKKVSIGAGLLLGGIKGAAIGTAGGFAAAGATTSAVMALGTASTGTAIATLHGAALTNATLAALGGGAVAAGGGGIALGTTILGAATLGVGLLVGGIVFGTTGRSLSNKADEAWQQMKLAEKEINNICLYLSSLSSIAIDFNRSISLVEKVYRNHLVDLTNLVEVNKKIDWNTFSNDEKLLTENTVLLVGILFNMCKVNVVLKGENENKMNKINYEEVNISIKNSESFLNDRRLMPKIEV